tara:strand:- start:708 stop:2486 length:1779 start_codon:yes stop_codon:yes gene_type:complete
MGPDIFINPRRIPLEMDYIKKLKNYIFSKYKIVVVFLLLVNFFLISSSVYKESITWDEICYIGMGKYIIETGNFRTDGSISHAPLSYYINSLFLYFTDIPDEIMTKESCWVRGKDLLFESKDPIRLLFFIRLPLMLLSVLLGFYVFKWAKELYGIKAGLFALFFYSFSPNIIATAKFALTDFSLVCFSFISMYYFWKFCNKSTAWNLIVLGFITGLALISKITALFLIPIYIVLGLIFIRRIFSERIIDLVIIFLLAFFVVFAAYGFQIQTLSDTLPDHYLQRAHEEIDNRIGNYNIEKFAYFFIDNVPLPAATYFAVIGDVAYHSTTGFNGYFFGKIFAPEDKPFYYFFGLMALKTPIPALIILVISIIFFRRLRHKKLKNEFFFIVPIIIFFASFIFNKVSYDLRHVLTIYPFIFVFMSKVTNFKFKRKYPIYALILLLWYLISSLAIYPYYVAYFNEFVQPENGYKYLSGFNIDAGQDLIRLKDFMDKNRIDKINFSFHGGIDPKKYGIEYSSMPTVCFAPVNVDYEPFATNCEKDFVEDCSKRKGIVAISVTNLQNRFLRNASCFNWLQNYEPISKLGYSIFVYNITE